MRTSPVGEPRQAERRMQERDSEGGVAGPV
jgi:hypothetical protein